MDYSKIERKLQRLESRIEVKKEERRATYYKLQELKTSSESRK